MSDSQGIEEDVRSELCKRLLPALDHDFKAHPEVDLNYCHLLTPNAGGDGNGREVEAKNIFQEVRPDGVQPKAWVIAGEAGQGRTTLARRIARAWLLKENTFPNLLKYKIAFLVEGDLVARDGCWESVKSLIPDTIETWSAAVVAEWLEEESFLLIVDDFMCKEALESVGESVLEWENMEVLLLTTIADAENTTYFLGDHKLSLPYRLTGLLLNNAFIIASKIFVKKDMTDFQGWVDKNLGITEELMTYPALVKAMSQAWLDGRLKNIKTKTELLWAVFHYIMTSGNGGTSIEISEKIAYELGKVANKALERRGNLVKKEVEDIILVMKTCCDIKPLLEKLYKYSSLTSSSISFPHLLSQFFVSWYFVNYLLKGGRTLARMFKYHFDGDTMAVLVAGHLGKILKENPKLDDVELSRAVKHLILHMDRAKDRYGYLFCIFNEFFLHPRVMALVEKILVYPRCIELYTKSILVSPLKYLLEHHEPDRLSLVVRYGNSGANIDEAVSVMAATQVPLTIAVMNHMGWQFPQTSDHLIENLKSSKAKLENFIGCIKAKTVNDLSNHESTKYLVCFRNRVKSLEIVQAMLDVPSKIPTLMWLELDLDLPLVELENVIKPKRITPLLDIRFRDATDKDIPFICNFLTKISSRYSGVHLRRSSVTINGAITLIKTLFRNGCYLNAEKEAIAEYRKWRYPALCNLPMNSELTDAAVKPMIGFDDCHHYSDNDIRSSYIASEDDILSFTYFLESTENLQYFRYVCANFMVTKNNKGINASLIKEGLWYFETTIKGSLGEKC